MSAARRKREAAIAAHVDAGTYRPPSRKSRFLTTDIRDAVQADLHAMRQQMEAQRDRLKDREWALRKSSCIKSEVVDRLPDARIGAALKGLHLEVNGAD